MPLKKWTYLNDKDGHIQVDEDSSTPVPKCISVPTGNYIITSTPTIHNWAIFIVDPVDQQNGFNQLIHVHSAHTLTRIPTGEAWIKHHWSTFLVRIWPVYVCSDTCEHKMVEDTLK